MAWSYNESLVGTRDKLRLRIGDTDSNDPLLADETLNVLLADKGSDLALTSIDAVRAIIAKLGREFDRSAVGVGGSRSQKVQHFHDLLKQLTKESRLSTGVVVGGLSASRKEAIEDDSDYPAPSFTIGSDDSPGGGPGTTRWWSS
jgi:CO dehydrogenase/acetyl-CoA synthase gamma subunit (corrinoid Fe-S protein)